MQKEAKGKMEKLNSPTCARRRFFISAKSRLAGGGGWGKIEAAKQEEK